MKRGLPTSFSQLEVFRLLLDIKMNKETRCKGDYLQVPKSYFGYKLLSRRLLDFCKKSEIKVHIWTINDSKDMRNLIGMEVDGIMTDKCRTLLKVIKSKEFIDKKLILDPFVVA